MPRLPVNGSENPERSAARPTIAVSRAAFGVFGVCALIWLGGIAWLNDWLQVDTACSAETLYSRKARVAEGASCALAAGPRGWLLLGWALSLPLFTFIWLERALRRMIKMRAAGDSDGKDGR